MPQTVRRAWRDSFWTGLRCSC